jgi:hypothetical protein
MNPLHLLWIIPLVFCAGFCFAGLFHSAAENPVREIKNVRKGCGE